MTWFYGKRAVLEILKSEKTVRNIWVVQTSQEKEMGDILRLAKEKNIPLQRISKEKIGTIVSGNHQGVAAQVESSVTVDFKQFLENLKPQSSSFFCLLDEIQDPQNLGAIIRSAACLGCEGVVLPKWRSAGLTETVMRSSSGAAAHLPVIEISNLGVAVERFKEKGFFVYGADTSGAPVHQVEFQFPLIILLGNEHRGIKPILKKSCDSLVSIPQTKTIASLNVSVAAAILFYEISRRLKG